MAKDSGEPMHKDFNGGAAADPGTLRIFADGPPDIAITPDVASIAFAFGQERVRDARQEGNDLVIVMDDGTELRLTNYYQNGGAQAELEFIDMSGGGPLSLFSDLGSTGLGLIGLGIGIGADEYLEVDSVGPTVLAAEPALAAQQMPAPSIDSITVANGVMSVSGTATPNAFLRVTFPSGASLPVMADEAGAYAASSPGVEPPGSILVSASASFTQAAEQVISDTTPPDAPQILSVKGNTDGSATASGMTEAGATVTFTFPSGETLSTTAGDDGAFMVTSSGVEAPGTVSATAISTSGIVSDASTASYADLIAPETPDAEVMANTNDGSVTVSGTAEPGSTVTVRFPDGTTGDVVADDMGAFTVTSAAAQPSNNILTTATDAAGNVSDPDRDPFVEITAPDAPTVMLSVDATDGSVISSGMSEAGATVTITFPDGSSTMTMADATGAYSAQSAADMASGIVTVVAMDTAGNRSQPAEATYSDTLAPAVPTLSSTGDAMDGSIIASGLTEPGLTVRVSFPDGTTVEAMADVDGRYIVVSDPNQPSGTVSARALDLSGNPSDPATEMFDETFPPMAPTLDLMTDPVTGAVTVSGEAEPGAQVNVTFPDGSTADGMATADGNFTLASGPDQPSGTVTATATDAAGNTSAMASASFADSTAPVAPILSSVTGQVDGGAVASGSAEPGSTVTVTFPSGLTAMTITGDDGVFTVSSPMNETSGAVTATTTDAAGNISAPSSFTYLDITGPDAPVPDALSSSADGAVTVTGTAEAGAGILVTFPDGQTTSTAVEPDGRFTATSDPHQPTGDVITVATDAAGNPSAEARLSFQDTIRPDIPDTTVTLNMADLSLTVSGMAEPATTVSVSFPDETTLSTIAAADGSFAVTSAPGQPSGALVTIAEDGAGNASDASRDGFIAPVTGQLTADAMNDTGPSDNDGITSNARPEISGTGAGPGNRVTLYDEDGETVLGTDISDSLGNWIITPTEDYLSPGTNTLSVTVTDGVSVSVPTPVTVVYESYSSTLHLVDHAALPLTSQGGNFALDPDGDLGTDVLPTGTISVTELEGTGNYGGSFTPPRSDPDAVLDIAYDGNGYSHMLEVDAGTGAYWSLDPEDLTLWIDFGATAATLSSDPDVTYEYVIGIAGMNTGSGASVMTSHPVTYLGSLDVYQGDFLGQAEGIHGALLDGAFATPGDSGRTITNLTSIAGGFSIQDAALFSVGDDRSTISLDLDNGTGDNFGLYVGVIRTERMSGVAPVAMDLNGDGDISYGSTTLDLTGQGAAVKIGWTAPEDGVLIHDRYSDGSVRDASQYDFSVDGSSDLEGLALRHDANADGVINADDPVYDELAVWQDSDADGIAEDGEVLSLADLEIVEIGLSATASTDPAAPMVEVAGETSATRHDGSMIHVEDAGFAYQPGDGGGLDLSGLDALAEASAETEDAVVGVSLEEMLILDDVALDLAVEAGLPASSSASSAPDTMPDAVPDLAVQMTALDTPQLQMEEAAVVLT